MSAFRETSIHINKYPPQNLPTYSTYILVIFLDDFSPLHWYFSSSMLCTRALSNVLKPKIKYYNPLNTVSALFLLYCTLFNYFFSHLFLFFISSITECSMKELKNAASFQLINKSSSSCVSH